MVSPLTIIASGTWFYCWLKKREGDKERSPNSTCWKIWCVAARTATTSMVSRGGGGGGKGAPKRRRGGVVYKKGFY